MVLRFRSEPPQASPASDKRVRVRDGVRVRSCHEQVRVRIGLGGLALLKHTEMSLEATTGIVTASYFVWRHLMEGLCAVIPHFHHIWRSVFILYLVFAGRFSFCGRKPTGRRMEYSPEVGTTVFILTDTECSKRFSLT